MNATLDKIIKALVDAAFHELQHDTGPQYPEYQHQRKSLEKEFRRILRPNRNCNHE